MGSIYIRLGLFCILMTFIQGLSFGQSMLEYTYSLNYGFIQGGNARVLITENKDTSQQMIKAEIIAKTSGLAHKIYRVEDSFESIFLTDNYLPLNSKEFIREGKYTKTFEYQFDHRKNRIRSNLSPEKNIPFETRDILSLFFYLRSLIDHPKDLRASYRLPLYYNDSLIHIDIDYLGKKSLELDDGDCLCHVFAPKVKAGKVFRNENALKIWFTKSLEYVPVRVDLELFLGKIRCKLEKD